MRQVGGKEKGKVHFQGGLGRKVPHRYGERFFVHDSNYKHKVSISRYLGLISHKSILGLSTRKKVVGTIRD